MSTSFLPGIRGLRTIFALGLALAAVAATGRALADDACGCNANDGCNPPGFWYGSEAFPRNPWYVSADGIAMQRLFSGLGAASTLGLSPTGTLALSERDLDTPFQGGVRFTVGHYFADSPYQVEASYFWLSPSDVSAQTLDPTGTLTSPFTNFGATPNNLVDFNSMVSIHQISRLEGGDINLKFTLPLPAGEPTVVVMFGARHIGLREEYDYASQPTVVASPVSVHAHTGNDLWGPQIGGVIEYGHNDVWIHFEGKAALCGNVTTRDLDANVNGLDAIHPRLTGSNTANVADINAALLWRPTAGLTTRIGYQALWVDQLALGSRNFAPDVASLTNPAAEPPINSRGTLIYHGPFAGLQLNW